MSVSEKSLLYDELPFWSAPFGMLLLDTVKYRKKMRVLDIGCGYGFPMLELAGRLGKESEVHGLDPADDAIEVLKEKIRMREITNAFGVQGRGEDMPFGNGVFDLIISNNGLNNVNDQGRVLHECFRVCKPGAQMVLTMNLPHTMTEFYEALRKVLEKHGLHICITAMDAHIFDKRKPVEYLQNMIEDHGFLITSVQPDGFKYSFTSAQAFYNHYLVKNFFLPHWKEFLPDDRQQDILSEAARVMDEEAAEDGHLEISVPFVCFDCRKPEI
ncbi:MAG: methyltransferase domain-containing protein [Bacteroidetes bacterium]|nr:methyltransferase domain-containing protein [Bacteroidota bacterium]